MGFGGGEFLGTGMSLGQFGYMEETERFDAAIRAIKKRSDIPDLPDSEATAEVNAILEEYDIDPSRLSATQIRRIDNAIS